MVPGVADVRVMVERRCVYMGLEGSILSHMARTWVSSGVEAMVVEGGCGARGDVICDVVGAKRMAAILS